MAFFEKKAEKMEVPLIIIFFTILRIYQDILTNAPPFLIQYDICRCTNTVEKHLTAAVLSHWFKRPLIERERVRSNRSKTTVNIFTFELDFFSLDCLVDRQGDTDCSSILLASKPVCS